MLNAIPDLLIEPTNNLNRQKTESALPNNNIANQASTEMGSPSTENISQPEIAIHVELTQKRTLSANIALRSINQQLSHNVLTAESLQGNNESDKTKPASEAFNSRVIASVFADDINKQLDTAKNSGASKNEQVSFLNNEHEKINEGFRQAKNEIEKSSLADNEIIKEVDGALALIKKKIEQLSQQLTPSNNEQENRKSSLLAKVNQDVSSLQTSNVYRSQTNTSDLKILTADGDMVTISFFDQKSSLSNEALSINEKGDRNYFNQDNTKQHSQFHFSIEGDIDEDEYAAISSLVNSIQKLQEEFFTGDVMKAYEQALTLGFDDKELAGFALDLTKSTTHIASNTYQAVAAQNKDDMYKGIQSDNAGSVSTVIGFIDQIKQLQEQAEVTLVEGVDVTQQIIQKTTQMANVRNTVTLSQFEHFYERFSGERKLK